MKVFLSVDIEGTTGFSLRDDFGPTGTGSPYFQQQLTREVSAACEGAFAAGATSVVVRDSHAMGISLIPTELPEDERLRIIRGLPHDLFIMLGGLQYDKYDAAMFVASHCGGYSNGNNVSHTFSPPLFSFKINGVDMSEFTIGAMMAAYCKVPVVFMSGDKAACDEAEALLPGIKTVATMEMICGKANISKHPYIVVQEIRLAVQEALSRDVSHLIPKLPEHFDVRIQLKDHAQAFNYSFYPGAEVMDSRSIRFETDDYMNVLRFIHFTMIPNRPSEFTIAR